MKYIKGLRVSQDSGEGEISLPEWFFEESALWQLDVLKDWMIDLEHLYEEALGEFNDHIQNHIKPNESPEGIERGKILCDMLRNG